MNQLTQFLQEIDEAVRRIARPDERLTLYQIGRMTLVQHFGLRSATNDFDVLQQRDSPLLAHALTLFGKDAERAVRLGIYLEAVPEGLPPTPQKYRSNSVIVPGPWSVLELRRPQPADLAVTKLKRFAPKDREDVQFLCDQGYVKDIEELRRSLESAFPFSHEKDGDRARDTAFRNLERVGDYLAGRVSSL